MPITVNAVDFHLLLRAPPQPYEEGEDVLVEATSGKLLWDATVIAVSRSRAQNKVNGYRVHYKEWSSRFDEWVNPLRVVEPSENNLQVQVGHAAPKSSLCA